MGKSLSLDLRQRVLALIEEGHSRSHAAGVFRISISSAIRIAARQRKTGSVAPARQGRPRGSGKLEPYADFLRAQVVAVPDITMPELAAVLWATHAVRADPAMLSRFLKHRLAFTYKKIPDRNGARARTGAAEAPHLASSSSTPDAPGAV